MIILPDLPEDAPFLPLDDPAFSLRDPAVAAAREQSWYARTPYGIAVLRHAEMAHLLMHRGLRQGSHAWPALNGVSGVFARWWARTILVREGADHTRLRRLVNPAFSPRLLDAMQPRFHAMAERLAAPMLAAGEADFMADFADPYAAEVLCLMLGLPEGEAPELLSLAAEMGLGLGVGFAEHEARIDQATDALFAYADRVVARLRDAPGDDFMSALVRASEDGDRLSEDELRDMILMLVFAGIDTTRNQLGLGMALFLEHPAQWDLLARQSELAPQAVEEVMRVRPTITWVSREATVEIEFGGLTIPSGTTLHLLSGVAGTDPKQFAAGFDITADRARHFGFGGGVHHCLGHAIARSDMAVVLTLLPSRMMAPVANGPAVWLPDSGNTGPVSLPIRFERRA